MSPCNVHTYCNIRTLPSGVIDQYPPLPLQTTHEGGHQSIFVISPCLKLSDVIHRGSKVVGTVCEGTVGSVLDTVASGVRLVDTRACLVVAKMIASLCVSSRPMEVGTSMRVRVCVCPCVVCVFLTHVSCL